MTSGRAGWQFAKAVVILGLWINVGIATANEPAHFKAGPFYVTPTFAGELRYIDNLLRSPQPTIQTWGTVLRPRVQIWLQDRFNTYSLTYELIDSAYFDSNEDDTTDHKLDLDIHQEFNAKNTLNLYAKYYKLHEERGTGLIQGDVALAVDGPLAFDYLRFGGKYALGNKHSKGRLELEARLEELEYQNFREFTVFRDRNTSDLRGTFYYRAGARSQSIIEIRQIEQNYQRDYIDEILGPTNLNSTENIALAGMAWDATARTSGKFKIGGFHRDYEDSAHGDNDGFHWEADLTWKPRTYSSLHLATRRLSRETNGEGDYVDTAEYRANWKHLWSHRSTSRINFQYAEEEYIGSSRNDELYKASASIDYSLRRWFDVDAGYRFEKRSSNADGLSYTRNVFFVGLRLSL